MRKLFLSLFIIIPVAIFGILILQNRTTTPQNSNAEIIPSSTPKSNSVELENLTFSWTEIDNLQNLKLIPNFIQKLSSKEIIASNKCNILTSAGFYATNDNIPGENFPLGLFIYENQTLSNWQTNTLFDGILSVNQLLTPRITRSVPQDPLKLAVQSGPIIKENDQFINLKIINDTNDRRILAAVTGDNKLFFLTIYDKNSEYSGPLLANVPLLISSFEKKTGIIFADIINLDGGSASVFSTSNTQLFEITSVGAFFCQF